MYKIGKYEKDCWSKKLDSEIVEVLRSEDWSKCYEMDAAHLLKLIDGRYVVVEERGCSCYSSEDADLRVFDTLEEAEIVFNEALKENK